MPCFSWFGALRRLNRSWTPLKLTNVYASCPICHEEARVWEQKREKMEDLGFKVVVGIPDRFPTSMNRNNSLLHSLQALVNSHTEIDALQPHWPGDLYHDTEQAFFSALTDGDLHPTPPGGAMIVTRYGVSEFVHVEREGVQAPLEGVVLPLLRNIRKALCSLPR